MSDRNQHRPDGPRDARRSFTALCACAFLALTVPNGMARADKSVAPSVRDIASAVERGFSLVQEGVVSWYGAAFHDRKTASGERFDSNGFTMAHPTLPFGTEVRVTNLRNGRSVVVRVNDRGPFVGRRIADLSRAAAAQLGFLSRGIARARIEVLGESASDPEIDEDVAAADEPAPAGAAAVSAFRIPGFDTP
jgi:rare lipoprotein A